MIRAWTACDFNQIAQIESQIFSDAWSVQQFESTHKMGNLFGFVQDNCGQIVAYGGYMVAVDSADILRIATQESARNRGIAKSILNAIISDCIKKNILVITLEVAANNTAAIRLYKNAGFVQVYVRKNYYQGQDAFILQLNLKE